MRPKPELRDEEFYEELPPHLREHPEVPPPHLRMRCRERRRHLRHRYHEPPHVEIMRRLDYMEEMLAKVVEKL